MPISETVAETVVADTSPFIHLDHASPVVGVSADLHAPRRLGLQALGSIRLRRRVRQGWLNAPDDSEPDA